MNSRTLAFTPVSPLTGEKIGSDLRIVALDVGDSRIGVALSDPLEMLASPLTIIKRLNEASDVQNIVNLMNKHKAGRLIVGQPFSLSGEIGMQAKKVKAFADRLAGSFHSDRDGRRAFQHGHCTGVHA